MPLSLTPLPTPIAPFSAFTLHAFRHILSRAIIFADATPPADVCRLLMFSPDISAPPLRRDYARH